MIPDAGAARGEAFAGFYGGQHAGRDAKDNLGPGMIPDMGGTIVNKGGRAEPASIQGASLQAQSISQPVQNTRQSAPSSSTGSELAAAHAEIAALREEVKRLTHALRCVGQIVEEEVPAAARC